MAWGVLQALAALMLARDAKSVLQFQQAHDGDGGTRVPVYRCEAASHYECSRQIGSAAGPIIREYVARYIAWHTHTHSTHTAQLVGGAAHWCSEAPIVGIPAPSAGHAANQRELRLAPPGPSRMLRVYAFVA